MSKLEAAELLGISERQFRRWCRRFEAEGEAGLRDRRLGKRSAKRVPTDAAMPGLLAGGVGTLQAGLDAAQACGLDGQRWRVAHNTTGPTTTTEAVN